MANTPILVPAPDSGALSVPADCGRMRMSDLRSATLDVGERFSLVRFADANPPTNGGALAIFAVAQRTEAGRAVRSLNRKFASLVLTEAQIAATIAAHRDALQRACAATFFVAQGERGLLLPLFIPHPSGYAIVRLYAFDDPAFLDPAHGYRIAVPQA